MNRTAQAAAWLTLVRLTAVSVRALVAIWRPLAGGAWNPASGSTAQGSASMAELEATADRLSTALRSDLACAGQATALLERASAQGANWSMATDVLDHIRAPLEACLDQHLGIEQAFVLTSPADAAKAAALRGDREPALGTVDERYLSALQATAGGSTATTGLAPALTPGLASGLADGLDLLVPVRGDGLATVLVLRYRLPRAVLDRLAPARRPGMPRPGSGRRWRRAGCATSRTR